MDKQHDYDVIGAAYAEFHRISPSRQVEIETVEQLLGETKGKSVLELACGYGFFARKAYRCGAAKVLGVDISESMIEQANAISRQNNEDIEFRLADVLTLGVVGQFDRLIAVFLFNYSRSLSELERMVQVAADNLKPGGRLVAYTVNPEFQLAKEDVAKYGLTILNEASYQEGIEHTAHFNVAPFTRFKYRCWSKAHYETALEKAGFRSVRWQESIVNQHVLDAYPEGFWDNYRLNCPLISFICER